MIQHYGQDSATIVRMRVRSIGLDPLAAQLRVAGVLAGASLAPRGLGPAAILCVRVLRDPLPGALPLQAGAMRPPAKWEQAVTSSLDRLARHAARPAREAVPANAEAVLFADQAELLACLAGDWCAGSMLAHWWWQSLLRNTDIASAVLAAWLGAPESVPAALEHLAAQRRLVEFVRRLDEPSARDLLQNVARRFALHELARALDALLNPGRRASDQNSEIGSQPSEIRRQPSEIRTRNLELNPPHSAFDTPYSPWQTWAPEIAGMGLTLVQQVFVGVGLLLRRAPHVVRAPGFVPAVLEWHAALERVEADTPPAGTTPDPQVRVDESRTSGRRAPLRAEEGQPDSESMYLQEIKGQEDATTFDEASHQAVTGRTMDEPSPTQPAEESLPARAQETTADPVSDAPEAAPASVPIPEVVDTRLGGVFYLLNLALFLNLYGDFTTPAEPGIALSPWDFVALVGRAFLGDAILADPIWLLLAHLSGRPVDEPPGGDFDAPAEWRLPPDWLPPFPEQSGWTWDVAGERLRVWHPAGFVVIDVPALVAEAEAQLQGELRAYPATLQMQRTAHQPRDARSGPLRRGTRRTRAWANNRRTASRRRQAGVVRWLGWLTPYLRARLRRALGLGKDGDLGRILCEHRARVLVTAARLDILFDLADLPIEIRIAGLDRDPGWVPAAGRAIAFHFD